MEHHSDNRDISKIMKGHKHGVRDTRGTSVAQNESANEKHEITQACVDIDYICRYMKLLSHGKHSRFTTTTHTIHVRKLEQVGVAVCTYFCCCAPTRTGSPPFRISFFYFV